MGKQTFLCLFNFEELADLNSSIDEDNLVSPRPTSPLHNSFFNFLNSQESTNITVSRELESAEFDKQIDDEILKFKRLVYNEEFRKKANSTTDFWIQFNDQFRILSQLARVLLLIPSSSSYIERYFSFCGIISKKYPHMEDDLLFWRSFFRAYMDILNEMSE
jgi:hypothetical protein